MICSWDSVRGNSETYPGWQAASTHQVQAWAAMMLRGGDTRSALTISHNVVTTNKGECIFRLQQCSVWLQLPPWAVAWASSSAVRWTLSMTFMLLHEFLVTVLVARCVVQA
jgi:hypothetical protein